MRIGDKHISGDTGKTTAKRKMRKAVEKPLAEPKDTMTRSSGIPVTARITILHTNDMHGQTHSSVDKKVSEDNQLGGLAYLGATIKKEKEADPENTLLLDAGDISTGGPISDYFKAIPMVDAMNFLGYDAMTVGNHEFDKGRDSLRAIIDNANFPVLSANMVDKSPEGPLNVKPYIMKKVGDLKVGILGLTTTDTSDLLREKDKEFIKFQSAVDTAKKMIPRMRKEGADLIIVLSHLGYKKDCDLAKKVDGIDVIVGGHSHTELDKPITVKNTIIAQAGQKGRNLGKLELQVSRSRGKAKVSAVKSKLIPISDKSATPSPDVGKILKKYSDRLEPILNREIGVVSEPLTQRDYHIYKEESTLCNFAIDAIRKKGQSDFAIINPSGLRSNINKGKVTVRDMFKLYPWEDKVAVVKMKGATVKKVLEECMSDTLHGFAISGMNVVIDPDRPEGEQVVSIKTPDGKPLDPEKTYSMSTRSWFVDDSAIIPSFNEIESRRDVGLIRDALIEQVEQKQVITAKRDGRLVNLAE